MRRPMGCRHKGGVLSPCGVSLFSPAGASLATGQTPCSPGMAARPWATCARRLTTSVQPGVVHSWRFGCRGPSAFGLAYRGELSCEVAKPLGHKGAGASFGSFPPSPPAGVVEHVGGERTRISKPLHIAHLANQHGACHRDGAA